MLYHNFVCLLCVPYVRMSWLLIVAVLCCAVTTGLTDKIPIKACGSQLSTIQEIDVKPCPKVPCQFKRNSTIVLTIKFTSNTTIDNAKTEAFASFGPITVPYKLNDTDACHGMKCPIQPSELVTFTTNIPVNPKWPTISVFVKWTLTTTSGTILCFTIPVAITE